MVGRVTGANPGAVMLYFGKVFRHTVAGRTLVQVACDKCGGQFGYEMARVGRGSGRAPYMLGQDAARRRAAAAAERDLATRLSTDADLVPCPRCNWVNAAAVDRYRRRLYPRATSLAVAVAFVGSLAALLVWAIVDDESRASPSRTPAVVGLSILFGTVVTVAGILLARRHLRQRVDPNVTYPRPPTSPPGTPPALVEQCDPSTGQTVWVAAPARSARVPVQPAEAWVTFRPGEFVLPAVCGVCLGAPTTTYRSPMPIDKGSDLNMPLCDSCDRQFRRRWWLTCAAVVVGGTASVVTPAWLFTSKALPGLPGCASVFGPLAAMVAGVVVAGRVARPYKLVTVDAHRGVYRFAADNPRYTAQVAAAVRAGGGTGV